jgi:uncharacterized protein (TIGR03435 family)
LVTFDVFNVPLLIAEAYGIESYQLVLSPELFRPVEGFYTIRAKVAGTASPTRAEAREMLQELLASRFQLKFHRESRETRVYALRLGQRGTKFRQVDADAPATWIRRYTGRTEVMDAKRITTPELAAALGAFVDRPVLDQTGLTGHYDVLLEATPNRLTTNDPKPDDISIFTAVQETLGLRLEPDRVAMPVIVVDAVSKPTEN